MQLLRMDRLRARDPLSPQLRTCVYSFGEFAWGNCARRVRFFFSIPRRFVTSPGSLVRCRDDRNQQHGTTPKTNQPTTNERTRRQTNQRRNEKTNGQKKRTNTDNETNQDRQQKPCNAAHTPYSRSLEGQARVQCLGFARGLLVFFIYTRAFRHQSRFIRQMP